MATAAARLERDIDSRWAASLVPRLIQVLVILFVVILWQVAGSTSRYVALSFGTPLEVGRVLLDWSTEAPRYHDLRATLYAAAVGYVVGAFIAGTTAIILWTLPILERFARPYIAVLNAVPKVVLAPVFIVWFGIDLQARVAFVTSVIFFVIFYNLLGAIKMVEESYVANVRTLGASNLWLFFEVYIPTVLSAVVTSLRISAAWALLATLLSEYLGANRGFGYLIANAQQQLRPDRVFAGLLVIGLIAVLVDRLLVRFERRFTQWRIA